MVIPHLEPTSFHRRAIDALQRHEPELWAWFRDDAFGQDYADSVRLDLLKATYRLERDGHAALYAIAQDVAAQLGVDANITLYRFSGAGGIGASIAMTPGEVHVIFDGPVLARLQGAELRALFGHELAHYRLLGEDGGSLRIALALARFVEQHRAAPPSWVALSQRLALATEVYADRGALVAVDGDLGAVTRCLLKFESGVEEPDAEAYLRQVAEVVQGIKKGSEGQTHPELFLRVWAMQRWLASGSNADRAIEEQLHGPTQLGTLDLLQQTELARQTRALIERYLSLPGLRTERILSEAHQFFPELISGAVSEVRAPRLEESVADYFGFVLLDLATADRDVLDEALAAALACAADHAFDESFEKLVRKELKLTAAKLGELRRRWPELRMRLADAMEAQP